VNVRARLPLWLIPDTARKSFERGVVLPTHQDGATELLPTRAQRMDVVSMQGAITLRPQESTNLAESTTREVPPALCVVRGPRFHKTSHGEC